MTPSFESLNTFTVSTFELCAFNCSWSRTCCLMPLSLVVTVIYRVATADIDYWMLLWFGDNVRKTDTCDTFKCDVLFFYMYNWVERINKHRYLLNNLLCCKWQLHVPAIFSLDHRKILTSLTCRGKPCNSIYIEVKIINELSVYDYVKEIKYSQKLLNY